MSTMPSEHLAVALGYEFKNPVLLSVALTHRSTLNENRAKDGHNERLEFLGDAVLELVVTEYLFHTFPEKPEGELTSLRSALVKGEHLADIGRELQLGKYLRLSRGEEKSGGRDKGYLLANALEAVLGALYIDGGIEAAKKVVDERVLPHLGNIISAGLHRDAKSYFQECAQEKENTTPRYEIVSAVGPDHAKTFTAALFIGTNEVARGEGNSKQTAEQAAAKAGLKAKGWE